MVGARQIEWAADFTASAVLGAAVGYSTVAILGSEALALSGAALAMLASLQVLRSFGPQPALPGFTPFDVRLLFEEQEQDELLLTDQDRIVVPSENGPQHDQIALGDIRAQVGPQSRVVQLFGRDDLPNPGELKARIDRHLVRNSARAAPPDASQDLIEALAELRRSLR